MQLLRIGAALLLGLAAAGAGAEVYRWTDAQGRVHYGDRVPPGATAQPVAVDNRVPPAPTVGTQRARAPQPSVTMFMSPTCGYCSRAARLFTRRGIAWRNVDITASRSGKAEFDRLQGRGTPLIFIDGERIDGFDAATLEGVLARHGW